MDWNRNGQLSIGELCMFLQGVKPTIERKTTLVTWEVQESMDYEIDYLFNELTEGRKDYLDDLTLHQALKAANIHMDWAEVKKIIDSYD